MDIYLGNGSRYQFSMNENENCFELLAISLDDEHRSSINTLNFILSAFEIDEDSPNVEGPDWQGDDEEILSFMNRATELFAEPQFVADLERALDEDRALGEWENETP